MAVDESIWKRLTRLFKSGPVVRHKVASGERNREPQGTARAYKRELSSLYTNSLASYGQYERLSRYADYSEMEMTPEIASALNIFADEATCSDEKGNVLNVVSKSETIKEILETLFFDILNIEFNLWSWTRNLCKFGDFVLFVDASEHNGILNLLPIPINEIEREEGYDKNDPFAVRFRWLTQGNMILQNWQIVHFRLLGNDTFLPYGQSIIEPARRIWRQLILIEDAMLVYRIVRSPERRMFKIPVGNIPPEEVDRYMEQVKSELKRNTIVDNTSGRVDLRYNPLSVDEDYFLPYRGDVGPTIETLPGGQFPVRRDTSIPLLDGRVITIEQLAKEFDEGKENWVHSVQDKTNAFVPGKVVWCGKNYTCNNIHRVWLDDGTYADMAPEHSIIMRDGTKKRADEISPGESVTPFRTKKALLGKYDYQMVQDPSDDEWKFVHKCVVRPRNKSAVHHADFNRFNNRPDNLQLVGWKEHIRLHGENAKRNLHTPEMDILNAKRMTEFNKSERGRQLTVERNSTRWNNSQFRDAHSGKNHWNVKKWGNVYKTITPDIIADFCKSNGIATFGGLINHSDSLLNGPAQYRSCLRYHGIGGWSEFADQYLNIRPRNHQIAKVEILENVSDDVFCMTVVGPNGEDDRHNFALLSKDVAGATQKDNGFFVSNTGDIDDVNYIQSKLFAALQVPKAYLGYEGELGSKATLSQMDVRFSKTIERVQKIIVAELNKIAIIHLFLLGYRGENLVNFKIEMANPSTIAEQQHLELWRMRFEVSGMAQEGTFDRETIYRDIFKRDDDQIAKIKEGKRFDALEDAELEKIKSGQADEQIADTPDASGEAVPGEEALPDTLGGPTPETTPEGFNLAGHILERNPGSEGNDASVSVTKGKDLFAPSEDNYNSVFGTEKQTASDPFDKRAQRRMVTRPFSEGGDEEEDDLQKETETLSERKWIDKSIEKVSKLDEDIERELKSILGNTNVTTSSRHKTSMRKRNHR